MNTVLQRIYETGIIPVVAFDSPDEALPLCRALAAGGLPAAEVTFRTACAEECICRIKKEMPEMLLGAGTVLTVEQADRALEAGAEFIVSPGFNFEVTKHVLAKGGLMMPGTATPGEMEQAMSLGLDTVKFFPAELNGGVAKLRACAGPYRNLKWMCTGGISAKNVNEYLAFKPVIAVGGTWMCKSENIRTGAWDRITALSREAVDTMLDLKLGHIGMNSANTEEATSTAKLLGSLLGKQVNEGSGSIFVGAKEFEVMKQPGRGKNGHIAIQCSNIDRAVYHLGLRGVQFDMDSMVEKDGIHIACYMAKEVNGFAVHLVQQ